MISRGPGPRVRSPRRITLLIMIDIDRRLIECLRMVMIIAIAYACMLPKKNDNCMYVDTKFSISTWTN
eukprot:SAG11_NODE_5172_length_1640_cov_2.136924_1_plen_68_part_00